VVGIYDAKWRTDTIYIPWINSYDQDFYLDFAYLSRNEDWAVWNEILARNVKAATFNLKNTEDLSTFRDYLAKEGYSQVGQMSRNRRVIVIQDKSLEETVLSLKNHIRLINIIKPVMLVLFGFIGFIVSYLLIRHRTNELAIMRSMGAKKRQVFLSFFLEQLILFLIGLIPAGVYAYLQPDKLILYGTSLGYFILCYLLGSALALRIMNRAKVMDILFTKE
jgi:ABC-type antimicrobial peptide transport system permease subunit